VKKVGLFGYSPIPHCTAACTGVVTTDCKIAKILPSNLSYERETNLMEALLYLLQRPA
jgi:hypothetical protein